MKFSKIAMLAKRKKTAILMTDEDGMQWISTGAAVYRLENMPVLDEDTVLTVMNVSDDAREKCGIHPQKRMKQVCSMIM